MNTNNLSEGMELKSFKDLCDKLGIEVKKGNSRIAQEKDISRYIKYSKGKGYKLIIEEIYHIPKEKEDGRGNVYGELAQLLLTDYFMKTNQRHIARSANYLLEQVNMINENYRKNRREVDSYSKSKEINEVLVHDFFDTTDASLKSAIETALKNLENKALIMYSTDYIVKPINEFHHRVATIEERDAILRSNSEILRDLGYRTVRSVLFSKDQNLYRSRLNSVLYEEIEVDYIYKGYSINILQDTIAEKQKEMIIDFLTDSESKGYKDELNNLVMKRLLENAEKRHRESLSGFGIGENKKEMVRKQEDYLTLFNKVIKDNIDTKNIKTTKKISEKSINKALEILE